MSTSDRTEARPAGWSIRLGRFFGIDTYIHGTFFLFLAFMAVVYWAARKSVPAVVEGVLFLVAVFTCVLLHEYGHALAARRYGIRTRKILLLPLGGVAQLERMPTRPAQELWIAVAGPLVNVAIAALLYVGLALTGAWQPPAEIGIAQGHFFERLLFANVALVVFNMVPAFPMDGGRVLRALLAMVMDHARATAIAATLGKGFAVLFGFIGLFANPMLILIAVFIWAAADAEARAAGMRSTLGSATVREAMMTRFNTLSPGDTLDRAIEQMMAGAQEDFPVLEADRPVGLLRRTDLITALAREGRTAAVDHAMTRDYVVVEPDMILDRFVETHDLARLSCVPVLDGGRVVGLLTAQNFMELLLIRNALRTRPEFSAPPPVPYGT
jgi:Zn-dependent protease